MKTTDTNTILATGATETATGSRLALRGMIWFAYGFHIECNMGDMKPAEYKRKVNAALLAAGRGKGEASTKSGQAVAIGDALPTLFGKELASEYETVSDLIQAMFNHAENSGASAVLRLVDWAKNGDPDHAAKIKEQKAAEREAEKQQAIMDIQSGALSATALDSLSLDAMPKIIEAQKVQSDPVAVENTIATQVSEMSDSDLATLAKLVAAEIKSRKTAEAIAA